MGAAAARDPLSKEAERNSFYADFLNFLAGKPHHIQQGRTGMEWAETAKTLVDENPALAAPEHKGDALETDARSSLECSQSRLRGIADRGDERLRQQTHRSTIGRMLNACGTPTMVGGLKRPELTAVRRNC